MPDLTPVAFLYRGPTDTEAELARYRDTLLRYIEGKVPPDMREESMITLNLSHLIRFMQAGQRFDRAVKELKEGLHPAQEGLQEELLQLRAEVARLKGEKG